MFSVQFGWRLCVALRAKVQNGPKLSIHYAQGRNCMLGKMQRLRIEVNLDVTPVL